MTPLQMHLASILGHMPAVEAHIARTLYHPAPGQNRVGGGATPPSAPSPQAGGSPRDAKA